MHGRTLGWRPGGTAWSKVQADSKTENLTQMKPTAKLQLISLRAGHYFWSFLVPGEKRYLSNERHVLTVIYWLTYQWGIQCWPCEELAHTKEVSSIMLELLTLMYRISVCEGWRMGFFGLSKLCFEKITQKDSTDVKKKEAVYLENAVWRYHGQSYHSIQAFIDWFSCYLFHIFSLVLQLALDLQSFIQIAPSFSF